MDWKSKLSEMGQKVRQTIGGLKSKLPFKKKSLDDEIENFDSLPQNSEPSKSSSFQSGLERAKELTKSLLVKVQQKTKSLQTNSVREKLTEVTQWTMTLQKKVRTADPKELLEGAIQQFQKRGSSFYIKLLSVVACAFFLADIAAIMVEKLIPEPPVSSNRGSSLVAQTQRKNTLEDYRIIIKRNLFSSANKIPGQTTDTPTNNDPVKSNLPLNLIGTIVLQDELKSIATIEDRGASMVYPLRIKDEIEAKIRVTGIQPKRVIFVNLSSGRLEYIELPDDFVSNPRITLGGPKTRPSVGGAGIQQVAPNQYSVARTEIDKALSNLNAVLTQARAIPHFENGVLMGYRLVEIVPGSIYTKLGIQENDVITGFNGQGLMDPSEAFKALSDLKTASHIDISLKRNGKQTNYGYDIN